MYLSKMWVGILQKVPGRLTASHGIWDTKMIGVVIRSGRGRQLGHFMFWKVSISGKKLWASGAEDRIYGFHHVTLEPEDKVPPDMVPALGWCRDGNSYAFNYKGAACIITKAAAAGMDEAFEPVPPENHALKWEID